MTDEPERGPVMYQDGDQVVFCDRSNPNAWLRSDTVVRAGDVQLGRVRFERV